MPHLLVGKILDGAHGVKKDGAAYLIPEEMDATLYVALGEEVLQVARVARVETATDVVLIVSHKGERLYFPPEQLVGLKLGAEAKGPKPAAGFR
jgi:hypothetical protein